MAKLVLFDIDGTLSQHGRFMARFPASINEVFGREVSLEGIDTAGKTDIELSMEFAARARVPTLEIHDNVRLLLAAQERYFIQNQFQQTELTAFEGTRELLTKLRDRGHTLGIVTGNASLIAEMKLQKTGLRDFFTIMACGDMAANRRELIERAISESGITSDTKMTRGDVVYVADTPADVRIGRNAGVMVIAVANGAYIPRTLMAEMPDFAFANFADTAKILEGIESLRKRVGRGYSLVLRPPEEVASVLDPIIQDLSDRYSMPAFRSHVTLAGPVADRDSFLEASQRLSSMLPPLTVTFDEVAMTDRYFRQLCFTAQRTDELTRANRIAGEEYASWYIRDYQPHMSMLYAYYPKGDLEKLSAELKNFMQPPFGFTVDKAQLWSTLGPIDTWHVMGEVKLAGRRRISTV